MGNGLCTQAPDTLSFTAQRGANSHGREGANGSEGPLRSDAANPPSVGLSAAATVGSRRPLSPHGTAQQQANSGQQQQPDYLHRMVSVEHQKAAEQLRLDGNALFGKGKFAAAVEVRRVLTWLEGSACAGPRASCALTCPRSCRALLHMLPGQAGTGQHAASACGHARHVFDTCGMHHTVIYIILGHEPPPHFGA